MIEVRTSLGGTLKEIVVDGRLLIAAEPKTGIVYRVDALNEAGTLVFRDHPADGPYIADLPKQFPEWITTKFLGPNCYGHTDYIVLFDKIPAN